MRFLMMLALSRASIKVTSAHTFYSKSGENHSTRAICSKCKEPARVKHKGVWLISVIQVHLRDHAFEPRANY